MQNWLTSDSHNEWLAQHGRDLLAFGRRSALPGGGAAWLDDDGNPDPTRPIYTWITARTVHVYALGALLGIPGSAPVASGAMAGLAGPLKDRDHGGWYASIEASGPGAGTAARPAEGKSCYDHAFVMLAAASAAHAGIDGARELLEEATGVFLRRFWDDDARRCVDTWDTAFEQLDPYRGLNANMHAVEALLSVASLTNDGAWIERAASIARFVVATAGNNGWRIPEHYDSAWRPVLDYNRDQPAHQFKPFGATVGHAFEWARLLIHLAAAPGVPDGSDFAHAATQLFERAVGDGWARDGEPGFVYTTDWNGAPVVWDRLHWVLTEAINTAAVLYRHTGDPSCADWYARWWDHAVMFHIDHARGSWVHQLDHANAPADSVWSGKPDLYHAFQATLVPRLPAYPMLAAALDQGLLSARR